MCGIVGMAGRLEIKHILAFTDMLVVNQLRGRDATGVIRVATDGSDRWMKRVGTPEFLTETKQYDKDFETVGCKVLIGHGRAKTVGNNTLSNAHPFSHSNVVGVHNGTLYNHYSMERAKDFEVDSELLYWHINEYGLKETIKGLDNEGAWALAYWDRHEQTLNFIRNEKRPLYFAHSSDGKVMFWGSEPWYFSILTRKGIELRKGDDGASFYSLPVDTHISVKLDVNKADLKEIFTVRTAEGIKGEKRWGNVNYGGSWFKGNTSSGGSVPRPFQPLLEDLNDRLPPSLIGPTSQTAGASTLTPSAGGKPPLSSLLNTASQTESNFGKSGHNRKLSLITKVTNFCQQGGKENTLKKYADYGVSFEKPKVSFRTLAMIPFITDNKTGREWAEKKFEQETGAICSHCDTPIGDLDEIHEIFYIKGSMSTHPDYVSFVCKTCVDPSETMNAVKEDLTISIGVQ